MLFEAAADASVLLEAAADASELLEAAADTSVPLRAAADASEEFEAEALEAACIMALMRAEATSLTFDPVVELEAPARAVLFDAEAAEVSLEAAAVLLEAEALTACIACMRAAHC